MIESPGEASEESSCNNTIAMVTRTKPQEERCSQLWGREDARNGIQWVKENYDAGHEESLWLGNSRQRQWLTKWASNSPRKARVEEEPSAGCW